MQLQNEIVKKHTPIKSLLIDWLIIFGTYLFIRRILSSWAVALRYCPIFLGRYIYRNPTSNVNYGLLHWLF